MTFLKHLVTTSYTCIQQLFLSLVLKGTVFLAESVIVTPHPSQLMAPHVPLAVGSVFLLKKRALVFI